jgi:hypothetical protein
VSGGFMYGLSGAVSHEGLTPTWISVGGSYGRSVGGYLGTTQTYAGPFFKF